MKKKRPRKPEPPVLITDRIEGRTLAGPFGPCDSVFICDETPTKADICIDNRGPILQLLGKARKLENGWYVFMPGLDQPSATLRDAVDLLCRKFC